MEVHRCRFVDYIPSAINALSFAPNTTRPILACGRANGDIEVWNPKHEWTLEKVIPGGKNTSVEALAWAHQTILTEDEDFWDSEREKQAAIKKLIKTPPRLFSAGLNAVVTEWDLTTLKPKRSVDSHGGAVWCMATNHANTILAVGCEDGCVRLFDIADGELAFIRSFDKQKTRILSLAWSQDDKHMVTGSANSSIYKWDVEAGRVVSRMTVDRVSGEDTLVWSVKVLSNGVIVSGDSLGHVKFWDGSNTTMIQSFNAHGADVLCLAVGKDATSVFSAGVDRKCNQYRFVEQPAPKMTGKNGKNGKNGSVTGKTEMVTKWILTGSRRFHSHDVRALALDESRNVDALVSGGVDVTMVVCSAAQFLENNQRRLTYVPQRPVVSFSKSKRLLLCRQERGVKVWRLGKSAAAVLPFSEIEIGAHMDLIEPQQAMLEMTFKDDRNLTASALSEDGHWIAVADVEEIKLFRVDEH
ncbi:U3 small nucleolar RNA-associated protein, partial [Lobosporangium transversale]